ncbi:hypothetical protein KCP75_05950 [Salmonella enterica subsp. enterica]|nr:hypothetical protein KCP75_05950 [Salmonella enterica subsp. enterica]
MRVKLFQYLLFLPVDIGKAVDCALRVRQGKNSATLPQVNAEISVYLSIRRWGEAAREVDKTQPAGLRFNKL